ncbi:LuxR C-terminal-related transcriptional regulator [Methylobacterium soli]|uniref:Response regulator transcription factor n=1 Tax=Methylobacterium soli TaxID=553447 RepID=A0A6L3T323_9HYPH|nr:response regulator transcription factor [Methylobacterium soli]KAB1079322.1 response regulator transcription factor [Methylobacterium soli]GJE45781.1 HTH-type transcriptional regulator MalT [Methylobacterium soli]
MCSRSGITLIASGQATYRKYLSDLLKSECGFAEVIERTSFDQALKALEDRSDITLASLDLSPPIAQHEANLRHLRTRFCQVRIAVLASSDDRIDILGALQAGAHAYIPKSLGKLELLEAFRMIRQDDIFVPVSMSMLPPKSEASRTSVGPELNKSYAELTRRQKDVFMLIKSGMRNKDIARSLNLTENTVKVHAYALYRKLGISKRKELMESMLALKH